MLSDILRCYTKHFALFSCISRRFSVSLYRQTRTTKNVTVMNQSQPKAPATFGRTELAQQYFPYIQPCNAYQKLRSLLLDDPELAHLAQQKRRTFLPSEVAAIYSRLGRP